MARCDLAREHSTRADGGARSAGWVLLALVFLAFLLRFYRIGHQSLWVDELLTLQAAEIGGEMTARTFFGNVQGPLHALLVHLVGRLSLSEAALRSVSAVASASTVPVLYLLGAELAGRRSGLIAAALGTLSPFSVWYGQEVRNYALLVFFAAVSTLLLARLVSGRSRSWSGYVASAVLAGYCNLAALFLLLAHGICAAARAVGDRRFARRWVVASVVIIALLAPVAWGLAKWAREDDVGGRVALAPAAERGELLRGETTFTPLAVPYTLYSLVYGYSLGPTPVELHTRPPLDAFLERWWLVAPAGVVAGLAALLGLRALADDRRALGLTLAVTLIPLAGACVLALANVKPFNPRYVSVALPALLVLCGAGVGLLRRSPAAIVGGLMAIFSLVALGNYYGRPDYWREDVRGAAKHVEANEEPGDVVLIPVIRDVFEFYYRGSAPRFLLYPGQASSDAEVATRIEDGVRGHERLWFVEARPWRTDPEGRIPAFLNERYRLVEELRLPGAKVSLYDLTGSPG